MDTIEAVKLAELVRGSTTRPPLHPLAAAYISEYLPAYAVLAPHLLVNRLELVITSDSREEVASWVERHPDDGHRAFRIT